MMQIVKNIIPFLDDILVFLGLISFIVASYLVNAVLGTYVLGIAFFVVAFMVGMAMRTPMVQQFLNKLPKR